MPQFAMHVWANCEHHKCRRASAKKLAEALRALPNDWPGVYHPKNLPAGVKIMTVRAKTRDERNNHLMRI